MPFLQQMNGLRRNEDAMKTAAGIIIILFKTTSYNKDYFPLYEKVFCSSLLLPYVLYTSC